MDDSTHVKHFMRSSAILNIENDDKRKFLWSTQASLHPYRNSHPSRVSNYRQFSE